jgi:hypothetical protein
MFDELTKYYQTLAAENKRIGSFVGMDVAEFTSYAGEGGIQYPCLCMETMTGVLSSTRSDNENTAATGGFAVLCAVNEGDYTAETEALQTAFEIGVQILARMRRDKNEMRIQEFLEMDIDNVPWETIGPVGPDNAFGILFKLKTYHPIDLYFNPEDWNG